MGRSYTRAPSTRRSGSARGELASFLERRRIPPRHAGFQAGAYAAARELVEAHERAGAHLPRPRLIAALRELRGVDPGPGPATPFGRTGAPARTGRASPAWIRPRST
ncbi:hypothetical protein WMF31_12145 [Sorangium sp. So ce1036]|uniref:hypothetical protein n=1 Tax=Sorangium sp. So ce1036 TaxID=3133328 RepID=UPI003EFC15A9